MRITTKTASAGLAAVLLLPFTASAEAPYTEAGRLEPWDAASVGGFGGTVSISGDVAAVGAFADGLGSVYVYRRVGGTWVPWTKLTPTGLSGGGYLGISVSVSPGLIVAGATGDNVKGIMAGAAVVFEEVGGVWTQTAVLRAPDGATQDYFGQVVVGEGGVLLVSATGNDDFANRSGSVYVFEKVGGVWTHIVKLLASDPSDDGLYGFSLALDGTRALIGARFAKSAGGALYYGAAYVVEKVGGVWTQVAKLNSSDGAQSDEFGGAVGLDGDLAAIGATGDDDKGSGSGSVYRFERIGGVWSQTGKVLASDGGASERFGISVALADGDLVVGAYGVDTYAGAAYLFRDTAAPWTEVAKMVPSDGEKVLYFGLQVAVSGHVALMATNGNKDIAYAFDLDLRPYGDGCAGTGGVVPRLRATGDTELGGIVSLLVEDGQPSANGILFLGTQKVQLPAGFGCNLLVGPVPPLGLPITLDGGGGTSVVGNVPAGVAGTLATAQAFLADGGVPAGFATTSGVGIEFR